MPVHCKHIRVAAFIHKLNIAQSVLSVCIHLIPPWPETQRRPFSTHTLWCQRMQECAKSLFTLIRWHNTTHTPIHTPDQRPCPGNLFQPICAAVRVRLIVSCVRNVSETVIGKSFETLKSLLFLWQPRFLLSSSPSLAHCQIRLHRRSISCSFHLHPSTSHMLALCFSLPPPSLS